MLKHSTDDLRREYTVLSQRYDSLALVLNNLSERDRNVFRTLFESDPYESERSQQQACRQLRRTHRPLLAPTQA